MTRPAPDDTPAAVDLAGLDASSAAVFRAFIRASRLHRQVMLRAAAARDAHPGQAMLLRILHGREGLSQRELGDMLFLGKPTITAMLQRMERAGTIVREQDPDDQRITRVRLTDEGRRLDAELHREVAATMRRILDPLRPEDRTELARLLELLADTTAAVLEADA
jgi:DNA-binding MarR family transcriptional regulator